MSNLSVGQYPATYGTPIEARIRIDDYADNPRNYNNHTEYQIKAIAQSLKKFGQIKRVGVWRQMVVVSGMRVWSLCEHHLLPFWADVSIGYIADGRVLGLSKFARIAHKFAHRLQLQEQLVLQIADEIEAVTGTRNVAVIATGEHLCMTMRGVKTPAMMHSSVMRGVFRTDADARAEFLALTKRG